ncbi:MAG: hypothetical protein HC846_03750 [Blastocatellia bacterium]|nr:hypothetical protein [Blastocatellia bacterium]
MPSRQPAGSTALPFFSRFQTQVGLIIKQKIKGEIMGEVVIIEKSVGTNGSNFMSDVAKIGSALVAIGPDRGGVSAVPLSIGALGEAIRQFQTFQKLPSRDGRVDPGGKTLKRINEILNGGGFPTPPMPNTNTGQMRNMPDMNTSVNKTVWSPVESSLASEMQFRWTGVSGSGDVFFFELDEDVVPNWFGVLIPTGTKNFKHIHIFFHPTPAQAGYRDANYKSKAGWKGVFHYLTDDMAAQFCAAQTGQVLIMPLMTQGAASNCGIFPQRWESIVSQMLGQIDLGDTSCLPQRSLSQALWYRVLVRELLIQRHFVTELIWATGCGA